MLKTHIQQMKESLAGQKLLAECKRYKPVWLGKNYSLNVNATSPESGLSAKQKILDSTPLFSVWKRIPGRAHSRCVIPVPISANLQLVFMPLRNWGSSLFNLNSEVFPMSLLTHLTQVFAVTDLIILLGGAGLMGVALLIAYVSSREN
jgi:hypothetical protein